MPRDVQVTFTTLPAVLPPGETQGVADAYTVSILNAADSSVYATQNTAAGVLTALFTGVANGLYIAQAQALDSGGAVLGLPADTPFTVIDLLFDQPVVPLVVTVS
jgi:hypothetical protein